MGSIFKLIRNLLLLLLLLILLTILAIGLLGGTDRGFAFISHFIDERTDAIELQAQSGNLGSGVAANAFVFDNDAINIKASELDTRWRFSCLFKFAFCLDTLTIEELIIEPKATDQIEDQPTEREDIVLPDIKLPIAVSIDQLVIKKLIFQPAGADPQIIENLSLSAGIKDSSVSIAGLSLQYQQFKADLSGDVTLEQDYPIDLAIMLTSDDALPDSLPEGEGQQALSTRIGLSNTLAELNITTDISGVVEATLDGTISPLQTSLPVNLTLEADALGWPLVSRQQVKASKTQVSVSGDMSDFQLSLRTDVTGEQIPATSVSLAGVANTKRISLPKIQLDTMGGKAIGTLLVGLGEILTWDTRWDAQNIDPSIQVPDLQGQLNAMVRANGQLKGELWNLKLQQATIDGELSNYPLLFDARLSKGFNNVWFVEQIKLNNNRNQLDIAGVVTDSFDIDATIELPQLENLLPELSGGISAVADITGDISAPSINLQSNSRSMRFNDQSIENFSVDAQIDRLFNAPSRVQLTIGQAKSGEQAIEDLRLTLDGTRASHEASLNVKGPEQSAIDLTLTGALDETLDWAGQLQSATVNLPENELVLLESAAMAWNNASQSVTVDAHCWQSADSQLCLQNALNASKSGGQALVTLEQYALQRANPFLPENTQISGNLGIEANVAWGDEHNGGSTAVIDLRIDEGQVQVQDPYGEPLALSFDALTLASTLDPNQADATLTLTSQALGQADVNITLDPSQKDLPMSGTVALDGIDLGTAKAFLPDFDEVAGRLSAKGQLAGTLSAPEYRGNVTLADPVIRAQVLPLAITGGELVANVAGQKLLLDGVLLSDEGSIEIDGRGLLNPENWDAELKLTGKNLNLQSDPLQSSSVFHNITIRANPRVINVSGDISIPQAVIDVEELPQGASIVSSDVVVIEDLEDIEDSPESQTAANTLPINATINIELGDDVTVSAYGLNANLTGDMDVSLRSPRPPQLGGEIQVVEGIFKKYGQNLEANGSILFVGPVNATQLNIDAVREIISEDRTAGLRIQGTVDTPEITLFTEPSDKSQDAILSYVVLGRDINEASDQEANLLAAATLALAVKGGKTIGAGIADTLGVQEFALETRGQGDDTELVVSGRLNDRLLLRYGRGVFDAQSSLYLRYDLTQKLYLEAVQGAQQAVDLFYSFAF